MILHGTYSHMKKQQLCPSVFPKDSFALSSLLVWDNPLIDFALIQRPYFSHVRTFMSPGSKLPNALSFAQLLRKLSILNYLLIAPLKALKQNYFGLGG